MGSCKGTIRKSQDTDDSEEKNSRTASKPHIFFLVTFISATHITIIIAFNNFYGIKHSLLFYQISTSFHHTFLRFKWELELKLSAVSTQRLSLPINVHHSKSPLTVFFWIPLRLSNSSNVMPHTCHSALQHFFYPSKTK